MEKQELEREAPSPVAGSKKHMVLPGLVSSCVLCVPGCLRLSVALEAVCQELPRLSERSALGTRRGRARQRQGGLR